MEKQSVLVTLTAPTCAGKSYLLNYIRNDRKLPCLVSTTTRPARAGEVEGVDYFFISEEESKSIEADDDFAELAVYNGIRYGVTKAEFKSKLNTLLIEAEKLNILTEQGVTNGDFRNQLAEVKLSYLLIKTLFQHL